jgi:molybdopterin converting factor subunit 1
MRCHVLLFANLAEAVGADHLDLDLPDDATVADAVDALAAAHPSIAEARATLAVAVDEAYCNGDTLLHDAATLALIPPVSGG